jgi:SAM-dependent methyltransferase
MLENYNERNYNEYPETMAKFYDIVYAGIRDNVDKKFYVDRILSADGPVLEVGVGTGRLFLESLHKGADVYGIDISDNMLNVLKGKLNEHEHYRVTRADMRDFELNKKFKLIISPFRVFSHMYTIEDQLAALKCIKNHLDDDGVFIFDLFVPNPYMISKDIDEYIDFDGEYEKGKMLQRLASVKTDYINQTNHINMKLKWEDSNGLNIVDNKFSMRYYFRYELEHLIRESGMKIKNMYGDYNYSPLTNKSNDFVTECTK